MLTTLRGDVMANRFQIVGFLFATLTLSGVALAQQGGGNGNGGGGGASSGGQNDNSVFAIRLQDHERMQARGAAKAGGANCTTYACNEPPRREPPPPVVTAESCGDNLHSVRDRNGRVIRRICEFRN